MKRYVFSMEIGVRDYEIDGEGIVNNAIYLHYLEHTRHAFCRHAGYSFERMRRDGVSPVVSHIDLRYREPLESGDVVLSCLNVEVRGVRFVFHQDLYKQGTGALVASAVVSVVCLEGGKLTRGDRLKRAFAGFLSDGEKCVVDNQVLSGTQW